MSHYVTLFNCKIGYNFRVLLRSYKIKVHRNIKPEQKFAWYKQKPEEHFSDRSFLC